MELKGELYQDYQVSATMEGARPHPASIVESAALAAAPVPKVDYVPDLPPELVQSGAISDIQLEPVIVGGAAHMGMLPPSEAGGPQRRRGFMYGAGTGLGKTRVMLAMYLDNYRRGRKKMVYFAPNDSSLMKDARGDMEALGMDPGLMFGMPDVKNEIDRDEGIAFISYTKISKPQHAPRRMEQLRNWLGEDFDGLIVFDEAHNMGNAISVRQARGLTDTSNKGVNGLAFQKSLPNARVVYSTATAATEVHNYGYADRLGLYGVGRAFTTVEEFIATISSGGLAALEQVAKDLKRLGLYLAPRISMNDGTAEGTVEFAPLEQQLTSDQTRIYDSLANAWSVVFRNIEEALGVTEAGPEQRNAATSVFWKAQQDFFRQLLTSMQMPAAFKQIESDLGSGKSVVLQMQDTYFSVLERAWADRDEAAPLETLDLSPRRTLLQYLEKSFPIWVVEEVPTADGQRTEKKWAVDSHGNRIVDPAAEALRDQMMGMVMELDFPATATDQILDHFGVDKVAEVSGRQFRVVNDPETGERVRQDWGDKRAEADVDAFMSGRKRILLFSMKKAGTGRSFHAWNQAKNNQRRVHYLLQSGWSAQEAMQAMGRTHRSDQAFAPIYRLVTSSVKGHKRFISSIARRLGQLGALVEGQRKAGGKGMFSEADNLESWLAVDTMRKYLTHIAFGMELDGEVSREEFEHASGLSLTGKKGGVRAEMPEMTQVLNRLLGMPIELQNRFFEGFERRLEAATAEAEAAGILDRGLEDYEALSVTEAERQVVYQDEETGAETSYVKLDAEQERRFTDWEQLQRSYGRQITGYLESPSHIYAAVRLEPKTMPDGSLEGRYRLDSPDFDSSQYVSEFKLEEMRASDRWTEHTAEEAKPLWEAEIAATPKTRTEEVHLVEGVLLPIYNLLPTSHPKIMRVKLDSGEVLLGRIIRPSEIARTLQNLGAAYSGPRLTGEAAISAVIDDGATLTLGGGWRIWRSTVDGEDRVEVVGPESRKTWEAIGGEYVTRDYKARYFVPTGRGVGEGVMDAILGSHPIQEIEYPRTTSQRFIGTPTIPTEMEQNPLLRGKRPVSQVQIIRQVEKVFGLPIAAARFTRKTLLGTYNPHHWMVRLKGTIFGDLAVAAHEVAHHIDNMLKMTFRKNMPPKVEEELQHLDYNPEAKRASEGFAEFVRYYLTGYDDLLMERAPNSVAWFREAMKANEEMGGKVQRFRDLIWEWQQQGAYARGQAAISKTRYERAPREEGWIEDSLRENLGSAYVQMKDDLHVFKVLDEKARKLGYRPAAGNRVYDIAMAMTQAGPQLAHSAVMQGNFTLNDVVMEDPARGPVEGTVRLSAGIPEIMKEIGPKEYDDWKLYALAVQAIEAHGKGIENPLSLEDATYLERELYSERFEKAREGITEFCNARLVMLELVGLISTQERKRVEAYWERYIPLLSVRQKKRFMKGSATKGVNVGKPLRRRFGHVLPIIDPIEAIIQQTVQLYTRAGQQLVVNALDQMAAKTKGLSDWVSTSPERVGTRFSLAEIKAEMKEAFGEDFIPYLQESEVRDEDLRAERPDLVKAVEDGDMTWEQARMEFKLSGIASIWRPLYRARPGENVIKTWRNGEPQLVQVHPDLHDALTTLPEFMHGPFMEMFFGRSTRLLKLGAVGLSTAFGLRNPIRDYVTFLVQAKHVRGPRKFVMPLEVLVRYSLHQAAGLAGKETDPFTALYKMWGGPLSASLGLDEKRIKRAKADALNNTTTRRVLRLIVNPISTFREGIQFSEHVFRIAEFQAALESRGYSRQKLKEMMAEGIMPDAGSLREALNASADVTTNFKRMGRFGRHMNQMVAFWNAPIEGFDKLVRTGIDDPVKFAMYGMAISFSTAYYWLKRHEDDDYDEQEAWLKYGFWTVSDGRGGVLYRIPRPHEYGWIFSATTEALLNRILERDPGAIEALKHAWLGTPSGWFMDYVVPTTVQTGAEVAFSDTGFSVFKDRPIVSQRLMRRPEELRAYPHTTSLSKSIAARLAELPGRPTIAPAKLDHLLNGYTGGAFGRVAGLADVLTGKRPGEFTDIPFVGGLGLRSTPQESVRRLREEYKASDEELYREKDAGGEIAQPTLDRQYKARRALLIVNEIADAYRGDKDKADRLEGERYETGIARAALGKESKSSYPSLFGDDIPERLVPVRDKVLGGALLQLSKETEEPQAISYLTWLLKDLAGLSDATKVEALLAKAAEGQIKISGRARSAYVERRNRLLERLGLASD